MDPVAQVLKRFEARIALALAKAERAASGIAALSNTFVGTNLAQIGPANVVSFTAPSFTLVAGRKVLVLAIMQATVSTNGDQVQYILQRDGSNISNFVFTVPPAAGVASEYGIAMWLDTGRAPGESHIYQIQATDLTNAGHTLTVSAGAASIVLIEFP